MMIFLKTSFSILMLFFTVSGLYASNDPISKLIIRTVSSSPLKHGQWSFTVLDTDSKKILYSHNSQMSLAPASGLKLLTSAASLELLGPDFRMRTFLEYDGEVSPDGSFEGNIYLRGEGDPTLGSNEMPGVLPLDSLLEFWSLKIVNTGIKLINGRIIADDSYLDSRWLPGGWNWIDIGNYYGAGTSSLCINENLYYLYFKPGKYVNAPAEVLRTEPRIPGLQFINRMKTGAEGSGDNGYIYGGPLQFIRVLRGTIPAGVKEFSIKGSIPDPPLFAAQALNSALENSGIRITGNPVVLRDKNKVAMAASREQIAVIFSPPLKDIIYRLNKRSVNLYAEQLLKIIGKKVKNLGSSQAGIRAIVEWLEENDINSDGLLLYDGSGLSRSNAVTTRMMVRLLAYMTSRPTFEAYYNSLSVAGDPEDIGYMKSVGRGTAAAENVRAKTGLIDRVRSHSGYVRTRSGRLLCFSMIANNFTGSYRKIDRLHEKLMIALAELP